MPAPCVWIAICPTDSFKYMAKASNGYHHSKGFTFQDFHEPIMIKPGNSQLLQNNCVRCHGEFVHGIVKDKPLAQDGMSCVHCHRNSGHGPIR